MVQPDILSPDPNTVRYTLSEDEFAKGYEHFIRRNRKHYLILSIIVISLLGLMNYRIAGQDTAGLSVYLRANLIACPFLLFSLYFYRVFSLNQARKTFARTPFMTSELEATWTGSALSLRTEDAYQRYDWAKFQSWTEDTQIFTLFIEPHWYIPMPKRVFTPELEKSLKAQLTDANVPFVKLMPF